MRLSPDQVQAIRHAAQRVLVFCVRGVVLAKPAYKTMGGGRA